MLAMPDIDFFGELEKAIRGSYSNPTMIVLGFASNPTAQCVELDFFERAVAPAEMHDIFVVHDLHYADILFDGWKAPPIMQVKGARDIAVEFFALSRSYHDDCPFTPLQVAAIAALEGDQQCVKDIAGHCQRRRDVLYKGLTTAGRNVECPKASMYIWARIPELPRDGLAGVIQAAGGQSMSVSPGIGVALASRRDAHVHTSR